MQERFSMINQPTEGSSMAPNSLRAGMPTNLDQPSRNESGARDIEDVFELLKVDHDRLASLFSDINNSSNAEEKIENFGVLYKVLTVHANTEEAVFYPTVAQYPSAAKWIPQNIEEHKEAKELLEDIRALGVDTDEGMAALQELQAALENHVREEEDYVFKGAETDMNEEQLLDLAHRVYAEKQRQAEKYDLQLID
jgi:hemerythrin superfamily protein